MKPFWLPVILRRASTPQGLLIGELAAECGRSYEQAGNAVSRYHKTHARRLIAVRWTGSLVCRYFATETLAEACRQRDPVLRVVRNRDGDVRVVMGKRVIDVPQTLARRLARELAEAVA